MVTLSNGERVAAHTWAHWGLKENVEGDAQEVGNHTYQGAVWKGFWGRYRLEGEGDYEKEKVAKRVFQRAATKVIRDSFTNARIQAIVNYHKRVKNVNMKRTPDVKQMHLTAEEFVQGGVDWIMKDPEAWKWICERWASADFQKTSNRNRGNRVRNPGKQKFGADGFVGLEQRMEAQTCIRPSFVDVFIRGHQGPNPENPEILCDEQATERLAKYKEQLIQRHGQDFDWRAAPPDIEAIYHAGDGLRHGRWGLGDGVLEYDRVPKPQGTGQGSCRQASRSRQEEARQAQEEARQAQEQARQAREETRRLREDNDYMKMYLLELSQRLGSNVPEFRPPQLFPQVPPNYFSTPSTQGPPVGYAQGSQPPPNWIICSDQASPVENATQMGSQPPQQWIYLTQAPPFGDASQGSQPRPQWMYLGQPMMYRGQQPMFYPADQQPYFVPWRSTVPPTTPPG
ncbi:hypothetical protein U9M48_044697 [Paspalum notatum var. saurae]|uniref:Uncharacterized protein n=1 Tax=Paspalum notatum var. saurae TaxID=547442 RepID=A0AAQ3UVS9_PASNO